VKVLNARLGRRAASGDGSFEGIKVGGEFPTAKPRPPYALYIRTKCGHSLVEHPPAARRSRSPLDVQIKNPVCSKARHYAILTAYVSHKIVTNSKSAPCGYSDVVEALAGKFERVFWAVDDRYAGDFGLLDRLPALRERMHGARLESKVFGGATPNFFRKPFGPGWALVGDAGYLKDPITAQGIADAFRDADLVTNAIHQWHSGARSYDDAMAEFQATRDVQSRPMFDFTCQLAALEPPPPEQVELLSAMYGNQEAMDQFCRVNAGTMSPAEFFAPDNVARIFAAAQARA
jgi:hypothetical protein